VDGDVLMEALGSAPAMRTALERLRPTEAVLLERRPLVDDPRWAKA
jgi:hypothetical protein